MYMVQQIVPFLTLNRQHRCSDPFTINTLSITQSPHFREKNIKRRSESLLWVWGLELNLCCRKAVLPHRPRWRDIVESWHSRLLHSSTVIPVGGGWTTGNLVCNFRLDMTKEWQAKGVHCALEKQSVVFNLLECFKGTTRLHGVAKRFSSEL